MHPTLNAVISHFKQAKYWLVTAIFITTGAIAMSLAKDKPKLALVVGLVHLGVHLLYLVM